MSDWRKIATYSVATLALAASAGCATRGYVRDRVSEVRAEMNEAHGRFGTRIASAEAGVDSVRYLALGRVGYEETTRDRVYFEFDSAVLSDEARSVLDGVADDLRAHPEYAANVYGFADPTGPEEYNYGLGRRRADAVLRYLLDRTPGDLGRYESISFGELAPSAEDAAVGEGADRRQALILLMQRVPAGEQENRQARAEETSSGDADPVRR
ncbi:MAG: OmpA family protein [Candidatus Eisenbacteria bacterium]|nr:OmpA family protein [Candidatus Eisenbacteria bacterium]